MAKRSSRTSATVAAGGLELALPPTVSRRTGGMRTLLTPAPPARLGVAGSASQGDASPQAGQAGSRQIRTSLNSVVMASNISSRPASVSPTPSSSLKTSLACSRPAMPGSTPSTPATAQAGASSSGGWIGYMQR